LLAVAEHMHIESSIIPRIATGFCGGLAHTGGMCGAVSGGIMAISLSLGRNSPADRRDRCYEAEQKFLKSFSTQFGELSCQKLTGLHLGTLEGQAAFKEKEQIKQCTEYVGEAVRLVLEGLG
jgi:C_GCAxxG_C_C family probable redox protein